MVVNRKSSGTPNTFQLLSVTRGKAGRKFFSLLGPESPVLQPHMAAMTLPASRSRDRILAAAFEAYLEEKPPLLCNLLLNRISNWHSYIMQERALLYVSTALSNLALSTWL